MRGGYRPGSGRKPGSRNKQRHVVLVEDPSALMPIDWMLAVLRDPEAEQYRRDTMAIQSAPYLHAKLNAVAVSTHSSSHKHDDANGVLQILSVPRGSKINSKNGVITVDGDPVTELSTVLPFKGTPALTDRRDHNEQRAEPDPVPFEVTEIEPPQNVTVLNPHGRRQHDNDTDGDQGPGAA